MATEEKCFPSGLPDVTADDMLIVRCPKLTQGLFMVKSEHIAGKSLAIAPTKFLVRQHIWNGDAECLLCMLCQTKKIEKED